MRRGTLSRSFGRFKPVSDTGFSPDVHVTSADLDVWVDAQAFDTLYQDSGLATPITADAQDVGAWDCKQGSGAFVQTSAANEPTYNAIGMNGRPAVHFDGTDDHLKRATQIAGSVGDVFAVADFTNRSGDWRTILGSGQLSNGIYCPCQGTASANGNGLNMQHAGFGAYDRVVTTTTAIADATPYVLRFTSTGTAWSFMINGTAQALSIQAGANSGDWFGDITTTDLAIGCRYNGNTPTQDHYGFIGEILVFDAVLSAADALSIDYYLKTRWGI